LGVVLHMYSSTYNYNDSHNMLYSMWRYSVEGVSSISIYEDLVNNFIHSFNGDVQTAMSFFGSLNINDELDAYAMNFVDSITDTLQTQKDKKDFEKFIFSLSKKYPNTEYVNWGSFSVVDKYTDSDDSDSSEESTQDLN